MANKSRSKYIILLVVFTVIFFISMLVCIIGYKSVATDIRYYSLSGRLDVIQNDEKVFGPDHLYSTLFFDKDYEEDFDPYWDFANIHLEYLRGRYADDPSESLEILKKYEESCSNKARKITVRKYIETIEERK